MNRVSAPSAVRLRLFFHASFRHITPAVFAAGAVLIIAIIALFVKPYIGMADNGDYFRALYSNGIYFNAPDYDSSYFGYFVRHYGIFQYYNENGATLTSSQALFIKLALWLNIWFYDSKTFDIRFLAAIYLAMYTAAVYLLVESLTWKAPAKLGYAVAAIAVLAFGDTAYTAYFNSFYGEGLMLVMMMFIFACGLLLYRGRYNDYVMLALLLVCSLILTTGKQQNAPMGVLIALAGLFAVFVRRSRTWRIAAGGGMTLLLLAGVASYALIPQEFVNINKYHAVTRGVLPDSQDPEQSLKSLGIDPQFSLLSGTIYYEPYTTVDVNSNLMLQQFYGKFGFGSVLAYYIAHPDQAMRMLNLAAKDAFTTRPPAIGNYERAEGKAFGAHTHFFSLYSFLKMTLAPKTFGFIFLWILIVAGLYLPSFIAALRSRDRRQALRLPMVLLMMTIGLAGIAISIVGAGDADLGKHEFAFTAAFDLVTFVTVADVMLGRLWRRVPVAVRAAEA
ncbi:hypothetical protein [Cohnella zeiphila]|uniref:Transmembrane protein n=1 Tax=Cohnella zeiphila TaxID=2761120 RepID=A0A7X0SQ96_9BACL|nr:hypothetical protein [Cohnella zeiphila]MBB6733094.1 hypothetical protein [Cohnella zeiphila]